MGLRVPFKLYRLLPALLVGLLPLGFLDDALLHLKYEIRGVRSPQPRLWIAHTPALLSEGDLKPLEVLFQRQDVACIDLNPKTRFLSPCKRFDLSGRYTLASIMDLKQEFKEALAPDWNVDMNAFEVLFYGSSAQFQQLNFSDLQNGKLDVAPQSLIVFLPENSAAAAQLTTPLVPLTPYEVGLNMATDFAERNSLTRNSLLTQFLLSSLCVLLATIFLIYLPITITLVFIVSLGLFYFALSMILFDRAGIHLATAAPLISIVTVYILGLSDRLAQRERHEWSLGREAENLSRLEEMRNNFLSLISHDLKTPIARTQANLERLLRGDPGPLTPEQSALLRKVGDANTHLQQSISTLLLLSRIESRDLRLRKEPNDLTALLQKISQEMQVAAHDRQIKIETELEPLFLIDLDPSLIQEVVRNLIDNALKYSPSGSRIQVRCGESENSLDLVPPQPAVWFEVQDFGPGIPPEDRARVTEKFFRGHKENVPADQSVKGTGLGLYLSAFFVEKHGGKVHVVSKVAGEVVEKEAEALDYFDLHESGTVVRVALPLDSLYDEADS